MDKTLHKQTLDDNLMLQFFVASKFRLYRHIILLLFLCVALYNSDPEYKEPIETYTRISAFLLFLLLVYTNMYLLVPKLLFKNRYIAYSLAVLGIIVIADFIHLAGESLFSKDALLDPHDEGVSIFPFSFLIVIFICASAAIKLFQRWMSDTQLIYDLKQAKTTAELEQLKNQINPHFLFNMLNNTNVLIKKDPEKASQVLMKLSDLLRYQLYDSAREKVLLTSDIHFLEDFLNLEKVRRDNFDYVISKEGNLSGVQVPPLLFISFVENAVKHNNDASNLSYVNLFFEVRNGDLYFKCVNSKPVLRAIKQSFSGLGLANIKRRLDLLFPLSHILKIEDKSNEYRVTLTLKL